jgi:hypothetical protein
MSSNNRIPSQIPAQPRTDSHAKTPVCPETYCSERQLAPVRFEMSELPPEAVVQFTIEAQMENLNRILDFIDAKAPDLWRQTDKSRQLLDTMQVLLNSDSIN